MKKILVVSIGLSILVGCSAKDVKVEQLSSYSLYDELYENVEEQELKKVKSLREEDKVILSVPKYIRVYRGSYKDENGNVVEGGMELIKIDNGEPNTDF